MGRKKLELPPPRGPNGEPLIFDGDVSTSWKGALYDTVYDALASKSAYKATYDEFLRYCKRYGWKDKANIVSIGMFLKAKCEAHKNASSFPQWRTHIVSCARREGNMAPFTHDDGVFLRTLQRACGKLYSSPHSQPPEWGIEWITDIYDKLKPTPARKKEYNTFVLALLSAYGMARPEDFTGPQCVLRAKHATFIARSDKLPFGGIQFKLEYSKCMRLTGKRKDEMILICGTGTEARPVVHFRRFYDMHSLSRRPEDYIFAKMRQDGSRLASKPISNYQYNAGLKLLTLAAEVDRVTARGARPGGRTSYGAAGALDTVVTTLGRWSHFQSSRPYSRQSVILLNHIFKALGVDNPRWLKCPATRDAQMDTD